MAGLDWHVELGAAHIADVLSRPSVRGMQDALTARLCNAPPRNTSEVGARRTAWLNVGAALAKAPEAPFEKRELIRICRYAACS